jgi:hypothetical protein
MVNKWDINGILMGYYWDINGILMVNKWDINGILMVYLWDVNGILMIYQRLWISAMKNNQDFMGFDHHV